MEMTNSILPKILSLVALLAGAGPSFAASNSVTMIGTSTQTLKYTAKNKVASGDQQDDDNLSLEEVSGTGLCQRVTTATYFGLEFGTEGCMSVGGEQTFASSIGGHVMVIYYPLTTRMIVGADIDAETRVVSFTNFYIAGLGGFSKITHNQQAFTNSTLASDTLDFGLAFGWNYRVFPMVSVGVEGSYIAGTIISKATTGSVTATGVYGVLSVAL